MSLQIKGIRWITYFLLSWVQIWNESSKLASFSEITERSCLSWVQIWNESSKLASFSEITNVLLCLIDPYSEITNVPLCCNRPPSTSKSLRTEFSSMRTKFYDWKASIKHVKIDCHKSCFNRISPCMIKTPINFTDIALKKRRKNVYIPLSYENGRTCLHPKERSRSRLSNEKACSLTR